MDLPNQGSRGTSFDPKPRNRGGERDWQQLYDGQMLSNGYQVALACGPLLKPRYINPKIEEELAEFKEEILQKCTSSNMNRTYKFPLMQPAG